VIETAIFAQGMGSGNRFPLLFEDGGKLYD